MMKINKNSLKLEDEEYIIQETAPDPLRLKKCDKFLGLTFFDYLCNFVF